jgi:capsular polysaccharide biosynthesis protein
MTAIGGATAFGVSTLLPKTYRSEAILTVGLLLSAPGPEYEDLLISESLSTKYAELATTRPIVLAAIERLGADVTPEQLAGSIEAGTSAGSFVQIAVEFDDAAFAADMANALAEELIAASPPLSERQQRAEEIIAEDLAEITGQIETVEAEIAELEAEERDADEQARLDQLRERRTALVLGRATLLGQTGPSTANVVTLVEPAVPAEDAQAPRPFLNSAVGALAGFVTAIGIVYVSRPAAQGTQRR